MLPYAAGVDLPRAAEGAPVMAEVTRLTVSILLESMITPSQSWDLGRVQMPCQAGLWA